MMNPLIYNTLQFEKYSLLTIFLLKNLGFLAKNPKTNSKFEKKNPLVCRARRDQYSNAWLFNVPKKGGHSKTLSSYFPCWNSGPYLTTFHLVVNFFFFEGLYFQEKLYWKNFNIKK